MKCNLFGSFDSAGNVKKIEKKSSALIRRTRSLQNHNEFVKSLSFQNKQKASSERTLPSLKTLLTKEVKFNKRITLHPIYNAPLNNNGDN